MDNQSLLDEMVSEDSIEMLKAVAKFLELKNTLRLFRPAAGNAEICAQSRDRANPLEMLSACSSVCHGRTKEQLDNMIQTLTMLQMFELSQRPVSQDPLEKEVDVHG